MKRIFYLFMLVFLVSCEKEENQLKEPTLNLVTVSPISSGSTETFTDISFGTSKVGYICGTMGTLLKTTDGGVTWTKINSEIKPSLNCIQALDDKNVYTARNELYRTKDGGTSWETSGLENVGSGIFDISFVNASTGFLAKNGVMKTTDSGKTWTQKFDSGKDDVFYALLYNKLQFLDNLVGFCAGGKTYDGNSTGNMVKTTDGGETWVNLNMKMSQINAFQFIDANTGFVFNFNKELWKTTDGGNSWTLISNEIPDRYLNCYFVNVSKIVIQTGGGIYHSVDGGLNWHKDFAAPNENELTNLKFVDARTGFTVGQGGFLAKIVLD
jgi:photosystem II stability/assembly factor-like uncharacterized protein